MQKIYIVLGMHRSATSLTAEVLSSYGLYVGNAEDLWEKDKDNQRGYFENKYAVRLNDKILYEQKMHWAMIQKDLCIPESQYIDEIGDVLTSMKKKTGLNQGLILKDPRMCLLEPIWRKEIERQDLEERIVMIFRHPYEVAKSLQIRDNMDFSYALKIWFYNNYSALHSMAACNHPILVLNHNDYFIEYRKQIEKIETYLQWSGINSDLDNIIDISLRHNNLDEIKESVHSDLKHMVMDMYGYLIELSNMFQVEISIEKLEQYAIYLMNMGNTSYSKEGFDLPPKSFCNCLGKEKKLWCGYQLKMHRELLAHKIRGYFHECGISHVSLYGNGTLTKELIPIVINAQLKIDVIYDKNQTGNFNIGNEWISIKQPCKAIQADACIINTVVNYGIAIKEELINIYRARKIIDLYELLYYILYEV